MTKDLTILCPECNKEFQYPRFDHACPHCGVEFTGANGIPDFLSGPHNAECRDCYDRNAEVDSDSSAAVGYMSPAYHLTMQKACSFLLADLPTGSNLIDIGCGHGAFASALCSQHTVTGVDLSLPMLEHAKNKGITPFRADATALPFTDAQFDAVICIEMIQYLDDAAPLLKELSRITAQRGTVVLSFPNKRCLLRRIRRTLLRKGLIRQHMTRTMPKLWGFEEITDMGNAVGLSVQSFNSLFFPATLTMNAKSCGLLLETAASNFILKMQKQ